MPGGKAEIGLGVSLSFFFGLLWKALEGVLRCYIFGSTIDIGDRMVYVHSDIAKRRETNASILYEVPGQEGDEGC